MNSKIIETCLDEKDDFYERDQGLQGLLHHILL